MLHLAQWRETVLEGDGAELSHQLGEGLPGGGVRRGVGLEHRQIGPIQAIGVDEIAYGRP